MTFVERQQLSLAVSEEEEEEELTDVRQLRRSIDQTCGTDKRLVPGKQNFSTFSSDMSSNAIHMTHSYF